MKTKNKAELQAIAKDIFERYPKAENVAVTSDGMAFITDDSDVAVKNHATKNRYGKKLSITEFERDDLVDESKKDKPEKAKTAKELIAEIEAATTVEEVAEIIKAESEGEKRKTVLEAGNNKLESLKADV